MRKAMTNGKPLYAYELYIAASADDVWKVLFAPGVIQPHFYGTRLSGSLAKGTPYAYVGEGDFKVVDGRVLEVVPGRRMVMTWSAHWDDAVAQDRPSRVTYELEPVNPSVTKLHLVHDDFDSETATYVGSTTSWPMILSSLKSCVETGAAFALK